jgi:hypothetical protein
VILTSPVITSEGLRAHSGWELKPEGLCKDERCVLVPPDARNPDGSLDAAVLSERLGMALVRDDAHDLWALGPEAGGRALTDVRAPDLTLPDVDGERFSLSSLRGQKVLLLAWASW